MKTFIRIISAFMMFAGTAAAQGLTQEYQTLVKKAFDLYQSKDYKASAEAYSDAFKSNGWKALQDDRYNAACSYALAGNADSAFYHLDRIVTKQAYSNYAHITTDADLNPLHNDKRWPQLLAMVKHNKDKEEANLNKPLTHQLEAVLADDQGNRGKIDSIRKNYGMQSEQMKALWADIHVKDSVNLVKVKNILDQYGWVGADVVGRQGALTLFLVIQHADHQTQKKYLPMMREAVKDKKASASHLALLEDRVAIGDGKKQIYGSQLRTDPKTGVSSFEPIDDEPNVNKRRSEVGLPPLEEYAKYFGIEYKLPSE